MLSERLLTSVVRECTKNYLRLEPTQERRVPGPKPGQKYMLYMHVPFCERLCPYCSFNRFPFAEDRARPYFANMRKEMLMLKDLGYDFESLYVGGGTPTIMIDELCDTIDMARETFSIGEVSSETNPNHLIPSYLDKLQGRVQRLSVGVQSFDDDVLRTLGRAHSSDDARRAIEAARTRFENVSVDLMCGIPGQSAESFEASAREAVRLGATHVSVYPLTVEPHTPFDAAVLAGELEEPDDDVEAAHMQIAARVLDSEGFERYEVASYARPGFACRHNIAYWTGVPYLGLGRSAATMTQNAQRRMRVKDGQVTDDLDSRQMVAEDLMLGMRMTAGVSDEHAARAAELLPEATTVLADLERQGLVEHEGGRWRPTERGWLCGNELYGALFDLAD